jgi:hypothetical protein
LARGYIKRVQSVVGKRGAADDDDNDEDASDDDSSSAVRFALLLSFRIFVCFASDFDRLSTVFVCIVCENVVDKRVCRRERNDRALLRATPQTDCNSSVAHTPARLTTLVVCGIVGRNDGQCSGATTRRRRCRGCRPPRASARRQN